ncbi:MAG TPA: YdcF family protein [Chromatiaceae bacterium]|nr:YdcF family protein [Chromatiaceae bacterium]
MFYLLSKLLPLIVYPLGFSILLLLIAWLLSWRGRIEAARVLVGVVIVLLWVCATPRFANWIGGTLESAFPPVPVASVPSADIVVLLGGMTNGVVPGTGRVDLSGEVDRLLHAAALYKAGKAPLLLLTGGNARGYEPEAVSMKNTLLSLGIPEEAMVLERLSRNTRQNAEYSAQILKERGINRIILVTSAYHMGRARFEFDRFGLEVYPAATDYQVVESPQTVLDLLPQASALDSTTKSIKEYLGRVIGYVRHAWTSIATQL